MVRVNTKIRRIIFSTAILLFVVISLQAPKAHASSGHAENRTPRNSAEVNARNRCISEGWQSLRYGAIWLNGAGAGYYTGTVNVDANASSVGVNIRGSIFGCHNTSVGNTYALGVTPQGANSWRLTGLSSTSLYRGSSQGSHNWSTQGGGITATLNVSGLATDNQTGTDTQTINIRLFRCFSTNPSAPTGTCYAENVPITVVRTAQPAIVSCSPSTQVIPAGTEARFSATGSSIYSWSSPGGAPSSGSGNNFSTTYTTPGTYSVVVSSGASSDTCGVTVAASPYLKAYGGEVHSGGVFGAQSECSPGNSLGGVYAFASRSNSFSNYRGASSQLTVSSLLEINGLYSDSQRAGLGGYSTSRGLTFANTGSGAPDTDFGGGSDYPRCITDYYNETRYGADNVEEVNVSNPISLPSSLPAGRSQYHINGNQTISGMNIASNTQVAVFVSGDVFIDGNIEYLGSTSWNAHQYFALIVCGDIHISSMVTRLDGLYVAQPGITGGDGRCSNNSSSKGLIRTCTPGAGAVYDATSVYVSCQNPLVINGSLTARDIKFLRMRGSVSTAPLTPEPLPDGNGSMGSGNVAEIINYTPEMYLAPSPLRKPGSTNGTGTTGSTVGPYIEIKQLPPIY